MKKTMKKTFFLSAVIGIAALFVSCNNNEEPVKLDLSTTAFNVDAAQTTVSFDITTTVKWNIAAPDSWVSAAPASGNGDATVMVVVKANETAAARSAIIKVSAGDKVQEVTINQSAKPVPPGKASISGKSSNCPEGTPTVILTAEASNATSYVWYNRSNVIASVTGATYEVSASGTFYAVGVNADGEGEKSNAKEVLIYDDCDDSGNFEYDDLLGSYNATGTPSLLQNPGPSAWNPTMNEPENGRDIAYVLGGWAGSNINILIDIVDGALKPNTDVMVARTQDETAQGYFCVFYIVYEGEAGDLILLDDFEVQWNGGTRTLDWSGQVNGYDIMMGVLAFDAESGQLLGGFGDSYTNLTMTKSGSGNVMTGNKIAGVKDVKTGLTRHEMFDHVKSVKRISAKDVNIVR
jgi:hypothetical protein